VTTPPRRRSTRLLATAASGLALIPAGCGSDDEGRPIPAQAVQGLQKQLDSISNRFEVGGGACNDIGAGDDNNVDAVQRILGGLPRSVDADVRRALARSFDRLFQLTSEQCEETKGQRTTPQTTQTTPQPPPAVTVPQPTQTETQPQKREEPQQGQKPGKGKGQGQGKEKGGNEQGPAAGQDGGAEAPQ
jgi:hypothetical protein